ncbi:hypothetical protein Rhow_005717 [Rhodococcus wratislaviensis]|uniref:Uncharacterized protein n=1 Tax=Rhodococcus wratislaviensis TaxID=44752 RepID=A0A402CEM9_RHOWR|nr:hypothetical protein [Rhodococcus wratislaviensis]GCE42058.1 hypothetical protein Rhow_005717 [Rhodococcus wratislaviensis]
MTVSRPESKPHSACQRAYSGVAECESRKIAVTVPAAAMDHPGPPFCLVAKLSRHNAAEIALRSMFD